MDGKHSDLDATVTCKLTLIALESGQVTQNSCIEICAPTGYHKHEWNKEEGEITQVTF